MMSPRSPKLDDPRFTELIVVPKYPSLPISACDTLTGDWRNEYMTSLESVVQYADDIGVDVSEIMADFGMGEQPYKTFGQRYPADKYLDIADRQDPADIAELDAVAEYLNSIFAEQTVTSDKVKGALVRAKVVLAKYQD